MNTKALELLHPKLRSVMLKYGYKELTPVQELAIPKILSGWNVLIIAPTGSGKTEAALFPVASMLLELGLQERTLYAIYITPLRALNRDIFVRLSSMLNEIGISINIRHGDTPESERRRIAKNPPHILITTPETFQYLLVSKSMRKNLSNIKWVIVDEVQEMFEDERGSELVVALERLAILTRRLQRIGLSAAITDPLSICKFLVGPWRRCEVINLGTLRSMDIIVDVPRVEKIEKVIGSDVESVLRIHRTADIIKSSKGSVLVFTNTRDYAEFLGYKLRELGIDVGVHHGSLSKDERIRIEKLFKEGSLKAIIATSSLELGIDIGSVELVIQHMSPRQAIRLIQRIGRASHRLKGIAQGIIIAPHTSTHILECLVIARRTLKGELERPKPHMCPLDVAAHQLVGMVLEQSIKDIYGAHTIFRNSFPFKDISLEKLIELAKFLNSINLLKFNEGSGELRATRRSRKYYFLTTMIASTKQYPVKDIVSDTIVGYLDEEFIASSCQSDDVLILGGRAWKIIDVGDREIYVQPLTTQEEPKLPKWSGELIPVDYNVAREVCALRRLISEGKTHILLRYPASVGTLDTINTVLKEHCKKGYPVPSDTKLVIESWSSGSRRYIAIHTCLGSKGSDTLALALMNKLEKELGLVPSYRTTPYCIILMVPQHIDSYIISKILEDLARNSEGLEKIICEYVKKTPMFRWRLLTVAKKMGVIENEASLKDVIRVLDSLVDTPVGKEALREILTEKLDIEATHRLLQDIRLGKVIIEAINVPEPSPIAQEILAEIGFLEYIRVKRVPLTILAEIVKRRLEDRNIWLLCLMCSWYSLYKVRELSEEPQCPKCGARYLAVVQGKNAQEVSKIAKKVTKARNALAKNRDIPKDLKETIKNLQKTAELVINYGKRAIEALVARGIGPETAKRILLYAKSDEDFYLRILEAERTYLRTRRFWD